MFKHNDFKIEMGADGRPVLKVWTPGHIGSGRWNLYKVNVVDEDDNIIHNQIVPRREGGMP